MSPEIKVFKSISFVSQEAWDDLNTFPFASFTFLKILEDTDCLGARTGWYPIYVTAWMDKSLVGTLINFQKVNSYGEYIFDFAWAQAFEAYGLEYYPKMTSAIPFTPATGPKLSVSQNLLEDQRHQIATVLLQTTLHLAEGMSSCHGLFLPKDQLLWYQDCHYFIRHSFQYHWQNHDYRSFDDFLQALRSKRRKEILRERRLAHSHGLQFLKLSGNALTLDHAAGMYKFYLDTVQKRGGYSYLTEAFFLEVFTKMKHSLFVVFALEGGLPVAGAMNYVTPTTLFGRHWGCLQDYKNLHFEICYYQAIEFAIERGLKLFEAGAQGEHKFQRGFLPSLTYSAHWIANSQLRNAIFDFVENEKLQIEHVFQSYAEQTPFAR